MALQREIWLKQIEEVLWAENKFYSASIDFTSLGVIMNKTVHVQNAGIFGSNVLVDNTTYPMNVNQRTDTELTFDIHSFSHEPFFVKYLDQVQLSPLMLTSVVNQMVKSLENSISETAILNWSYGLPAGSILASTGTTRPAGNSYQSGNRKAFDFVDFMNAKKLLDQQNVPTNGRKILVSAQGYADILNLTKYEHALIKMGEILDSGAVAQFLGCEVFMRGGLGVYFDTSAATFKAVTTGATAATASDFFLMWHPDYVGQCKGSVANSGIQIFEQAANPIYQADLISAVVLHGSTRVRYDDKGIVACYETVV